MRADLELLRAGHSLKRRQARQRGLKLAVRLSPLAAVGLLVAALLWPRFNASTLQRINYQPPWPTCPSSHDEDDLYAALEYLESQQKTIELALAKAAPKGAMFLYDVTSVYFEGTDNELAEFGYNRDGKKGKKQMVAGLLTDGTGEPLSIHAV